MQLTNCLQFKAFDAILVLVRENATAVKFTGLDKGPKQVHCWGWKCVSWGSASLCPIFNLLQGDFYKCRGKWKGMVHSFFRIHCSDQTIHIQMFNCYGHSTKKNGQFLFGEKYVFMRFSLCSVFSFLICIVFNQRPTNWNGWACDSKSQYQILNVAFKIKIKMGLMPDYLKCN